MRTGNVEFLKRTACTIASQLPEEREDALAVLDYVREIVLNLGVSWAPPSVAILRLVPKLTALGNPE